MSAGAFEFTKYETDAGAILRARVQPETLALVIDGTTNAAPTGDIDDQGSVLISSRRRNGVNARYVSLTWTGTPPTGYKDGGTLRVPIMTPTAFNAIAPGDTGTYLGANVRVAGKTGEKVV